MFKIADLGFTAGGTIIFLAAVSSPLPSYANSQAFMKKLSGLYYGNGVMQFTNGERWKLRCKPMKWSGSTSSGKFTWSIKCKTHPQDSYKLHITANAKFGSDGKVSGSWRENTYDISGRITGSVKSGSSMRLKATATSFTATWNWTAKKCKQQIQVRPNKVARLVDVRFRKTGGC